MRQRRVWIVAAVAIVCAVAVIGGSVRLWHLVGNSGISPAGWIALALGGLLSLALGVGLMTLVFFSSRRGYDDEIGHDDRG